MSLSKKFRITERQSVEFRFDAINAFNTPIFTVSGYATDALPPALTPARYASAVPKKRRFRTWTFPFA